MTFHLSRITKQVMNWMSNKVLTLHNTYAISMKKSEILE